jgi:Ca2+-transporting ATPase
MDGGDEEANKVSKKKNNQNMVNVRLITGDHIETAKYVACKAGIIKRVDNVNGVVMTGEEFRNKLGSTTDMGEHIQGYAINKETNEVTFTDIGKFQKIVSNLRVIARATDEDKLLLVAGIMEKNGIPLVSGKQIADARALKAASVGVALGSGCLVAKENADLVILNNDFKSIYNSIMWGRTIYENVRKFVQFQLTMNISLLTTVFIAACSMGKPPFSVFQLLWMNLVMDVLAACAICTEPFVHSDKIDETNLL